MDAQDFRSLQEAYLDVYEEVDDEGRAYRKPTGAEGRPIVRTELPDHMKSPKPRPVMTYAERRKKEAGKTPEQKEAEKKKTRISTNSSSSTTKRTSRPLRYYPLTSS